MNKAPNSKRLVNTKNEESRIQSTTTAGAVALMVGLTLIVILVTVINRTEWKEEGLAAAGDYEPGVRGKMRVNAQTREVLFFEAGTPPAREFIGINYAEPWMNDPSEVANREVFRLTKAKINGETRFLLQTVAQKGFWWTSGDTKLIRLLASWSDHHERGSTPHLSIWTSDDGGETFRKSDWSIQGRASGFYFDSTGAIGYLPVDDRFLWRTIDGGQTWKQVVLPLTDVGQPLSFRFSIIDSATVDSNGTFWLTTMDRSGQTPASVLYALQTSDEDENGFTFRPVARLDNERIFQMDWKPEGGVYALSYTCFNSECSEPLHDDQRDNTVMNFRFIDGGVVSLKHTFSRYVDFLEESFVGLNGEYVVFMHNSWNKRRLFATKDGGRTWREDDYSRYRVISNAIDIQFKTEWQYRYGDILFSRPLD